MNRDDWRLVIPVHLAETREQAIEDVRLGGGRFQREYFETTMGRPWVVDGPPEMIVDHMIEQGAWIIGTPDDCIESINRMQERSGGFGAFMVMTVDWAPREKILHSFELLARYVMPAFQGSTLSTASSNLWATERNAELSAGRVRAVEKATADWEARAGVAT